MVTEILTKTSKPTAEPDKNFISGKVIDSYPTNNGIVMDHGLSDRKYIYPTGTIFRVRERYTETRGFELIIELTDGHTATFRGAKVSYYHDQ